MKTSEVLKKKLGNISETVKEVSVIQVTINSSLSFDCHVIGILFTLMNSPLQGVCVSMCVDRG